MKSLLIIISLLAIVHFCFSQNKNSITIKVSYVDCAIETFASVPCNMFDSEFSKEKNIGWIKNSELQKSKASLNGFVKVKANSIDVRGKIEFILHRHKYKYCFDKFGQFTDNIRFYKNILLFKLIKQIFPKFCS